MEQIIPTVQIVIAVIGLVGNAVTIMVILLMKKLRKEATLWYILQIAFAGLLLCATLPARYIEGLNNQWTFSILSCKIVETLQMMNYHATAIFVSALSVDLYLHSKSRSAKRKLVACFLIPVGWIVTILFSIPAMIMATKTGFEPSCKCSLDFRTPKLAIVWCKDLGFSDEELDFCLSWAPKAMENKCNSYRQQYLTIYSDLMVDLDLNVTEIENYQYKRTVTFFNDDEAYPTECQSGKQSMLIGTQSVAFTVMYMFPILVMLVFYYGVISRPTHLKSNQNRFQLDLNGWLHCKVLGMGLGILFAFCWIPFHAVNMARIRGITGLTNESCYQLHETVKTIGFANSALNPLACIVIGGILLMSRVARKFADEKK